MGSESDSGHDPDERELETEWLDLSEDSSPAVTPAGNTSTADTRADASDWIASFRDLDFTWNDPGQLREPPGWSEDEWLLSPNNELRTESDVHATGDAGADSPEASEWWSTFPDDAAAFAVDKSPAFAADTEGLRADSVATATAAGFGDMPTAGWSRKRVAIVAAVVVLLVVVAAVGIVALVGRNGGAKSSSSVATTAKSERSTVAGSGAVTTTLATPAAPSSPSALPSAPSPFTVHSTCGGRDCTVAVRAGSSTAAKKVGSLRNGEVVQIKCSTNGESIEDRDTGRRSDVWFRLADTDSYLSALYLDGPTVPNCG